MELYLSPKVIGKGPKGRTACGSSAYRACDKVKDNTGRVHDYKNKKGYITGGIELPAGAPEELRNRQILWSRHESKDIRKDAELFREITTALPNEIDYAAAERIAKGLAKKLTDKGMCVQWDIHDTTHNGKRNLHLHMMITMRELLPDGTFGNKNRTWNKYNGGLNIANMLRPEAARLMNQELEAIGSSEHVEHKSYADRGIDKIPTKHMGAAATALERKGAETRKGNENRYIDFLNKIHAENLKEAEVQINSRELNGLIDAANARARKDGTVVFKDWDALFAMLRDTRRCRAAMNGELNKLNKVMSAYENNNVKYLEWAGCEPENDDQKMTLQMMQKDLRLKIKQMDITERMLLNSKELYKAHNKVIYTAKKVAWDEYQIDRNKRWMSYCIKRVKSLESYMSYLNRSISLFDVIFETDEWKKYRTKMDELQKQRSELKESFVKARAELQKNKTALKEHKKEVREAKKAVKKATVPTDPDDR